MPNVCRRSWKRTGRAQLESIRERGVARERDEAILGGAGVEAPIFDHSGHEVGAGGDTERIVPRGPAKGFVAAVAEAAAGISRELGARPWAGTGRRAPLIR